MTCVGGEGRGGERVGDGRRDREGEMFKIGEGREGESVGDERRDREGEMAKIRQCEMLHVRTCLKAARRAMHRALEPQTMPSAYCNPSLTIAG